MHQQRINLQFGQQPPRHRSDPAETGLCANIGSDRKAYFKVTSDLPLASFALFGTWSGSVLSAIPAQ
jgi:hypothetical protein